jgi:alkanesulfonate monooxygenase SsuD/methylene tetrahydromethanopterin reductase-like flavin-dependent oxidoreductase (luciferase family)
VRTLDSSGLSLGYLLPTRDAVLDGQKTAAPLLALAEQAEALGFDAIWVGDGPLARPRHDPLAMLGALAARTEHAFLGTGVLIAALRPALLLAQTAATLDQIAEGRLVLGVGAGFPFPETERQFQAVGVPYEGRLARMTETIGAMRALWDDPGGPIDYTGTHLKLTGVALQPAPFRTGGPPIWLAGAGATAEQRVGDIADGWLPYSPSAELYAEGHERVRIASDRAGRQTPPLAGLYVTVALDRSEAAARARLRENVERYYGQPLELVSLIQAMYAGSPSGLAAWLEPYIRAGARHIVLRVSDEDATRGLRAAGEAREIIMSTLAPITKEPG